MRTLYTIPMLAILTLQYAKRVLARYNHHHVTVLAAVACPRPRVHAANRRYYRLQGLTHVAFLILLEGFDVLTYARGGLLLRGGAMLEKKGAEEAVTKGHGGVEW